MKPAILAPRGAVDSKPPHGAPCNRCGLCCRATLCQLAARVFHDRALPVGSHIPGPCPALSFDEAGASSCGIADHPMRYAMGVALRHGVDQARASAHVLIGSGTGCDARINGEPTNEEFSARLRQCDRDHRREVSVARRVWGMG